jgi:hypothetical protein
MEAMDAKTPFISGGAHLHSSSGPHSGAHHSSVPTTVRLTLLRGTSVGVARGQLVARADRSVGGRGSGHRMLSPICHI